MKIESLTLYTEKPNILFDFYTQKLGLNTIQTANGFKIIFPNQSEILFEKSEKAQYYHFALNIAENQIEQALDFVRKIAEPLPDTDTGREIVDFPAWNAHSVYFLDPDNNIVELIARHELSNKRAEDFDIESILEISEIGTPCLSVGDTFKLLNQKCHLNRYSGDFETFCATGDEHGLFILKETSGHWFPTLLPTVQAPYLITIESLLGKYNLKYEGGKLSIVP